MPRSIPRLASLLLVGALLAACGDDAPSGEGAEPKANADGGPASGAPAATAPDVADTSLKFDPHDTASGTLSLVATGEHADTVTFKDVNGSINERAGGGETRVMLQLEAHDDPVHFKLRLLTPSGDFESGIYAIGAAENGVDATYENAGVYYKSFGNSKGSVSLTSVRDDRAVGSFDMTLESLEEKPRVAQVKGTFDMRIQR